MNVPGSGGLWRRLGKLGRHVLLLPSALLVATMIAVPLMTLGLFSLFTKVHPLSGFTLEQYAVLLRVGVYTQVLFKTLGVASLVTAVTLVIAWPAGWIVSRLSQRTQLVAVALLVLPYLTSYLLLIYSMYVVIAPRGPVMTFLNWIGVSSSEATILYTPWATIVMLIYESIPIMVLVMYAGSDRVPDSMLDAARSLGAGRFSMFRRIILPLSLPSVVIGGVLVFIPTLGVFAESQILGGPRGLLFGNLINDQMNVVNNQPFAAGLSFVLLGSVILIAVALSVLARLLRREVARQPTDQSGRRSHEVPEDAA